VKFLKYLFAGIHGRNDQTSDPPPPEILDPTRPVRHAPRDLAGAVLLGFVRHIVQRLKVLCPTLGKAKIAEVLARGLHLGSTTVRRMLREPPRLLERQAASDSRRRLTAKRSYPVLHVNLTTVPISRGFWASWLPFAIPQRWPHCWWIAVALDHNSRRAMGVALFERVPSPLEVQRFLGRMFRRENAVPKYIVTDQGKQFRCHEFKKWCQRKGIAQRFGVPSPSTGASP